MSLTISRCTLTAITVGIVSLSATLQAQAQAQAAERPKAVVGAGVAYVPEYSGADKMRLQPAIYGEYNFGNGAYISSVRGLGYAMDVDAFTLSAALGYRAGREDHRKTGRIGSDYLKGMGDIDGAATINLGASTRVGMVTFGLGTQIDISGDNKGKTFSLRASTPLYTSTSDQVELSGSAVYADRKHAQTWYGVSAAQHLSSGFKAYEASKGFEKVGVSVAWNHKIDNHWSVRTAAGLTTLVGDAADSPIVQKKTTPMLVSTVNYAF